MPDVLPDAAVGALLRDLSLPREFAALCDAGGRRAGTPSERAALALVRAMGQEAMGQAPVVLPAPYRGWVATEAALHLVGERGRIPLVATPLLRSAPTGPEGLEAEVVSVGRGTAEEFTQAAGLLPGRFALVRHEYMFMAGHIHRRVKYRLALEAGAAGFLIAGPLPGAAVAGSSGRGAEPGIPAFGVSPEAAARLVGVRAHAVLHTEERDEPTETILFDTPGATPGWVVLSAHVDGHDPAESAMDNATGVAVALAVGRALAPHAASFRRGLRLAFFSAEEWALTGSRVYVAGLSAEERAQVALNVNLDSVGGDGQLAALCSGFPGVAAFVQRTSAAAGLPLRTYLPPMENSDHANFAAAGIPALRLVAGFDRPESNLRHVLTAADTRDKVAEAELRLAALTAAALTWAALTMPDEAARALRRS